MSAGQVLPCLLLVFLGFIATGANGLSAYCEMVQSMENFRFEVGKHQDKNSDDYRRFSNAVDIVEDVGKDEDDDDTLDGISDVIDSITDSVEYFTSGDALSIAIGSVQIATAFISMVFPGVGGVLQSILGLGGQLFSIFYKQESEPNVFQVLEELLNIALKDFKDEDLKDKASGHNRVMMHCKDVLDAFIAANRTVSNELIVSLHDDCFPDSVSQFLGELESTIKTAAGLDGATKPRNPEKPKDSNEAANTEQRRAWSRIRIYTDLACMRDMIYMELMSFYKMQEREDYILLVLTWFNSETEADRRVLKDMITLPNWIYVGMAAFLRPIKLSAGEDDQITVVEYMKSKRVDNNFRGLCRDVIIDSNNPTQGFYARSEEFTSFEIFAGDDGYFYLDEFKRTHFRAIWKSQADNEFVHLGELSIIDPSSERELKVCYKNAEEQSDDLIYVQATSSSSGLECTWKAIELADMNVVFVTSTESFRSGYLCHTSSILTRLHLCIGGPEDKHYMRWRALPGPPADIDVNVRKQCRRGFRLRDDSKYCQLNLGDY